MNKPEWWKCKRVLITGATGFIGSALADVLRSFGCEVAAIVRSTDFSRPFFRTEGGALLRTRLFTGDIRDYQTCLRAFVQFEPEVVFHLAAVTQVVEARGMPLETFETNVMGTVNMLEAMRQFQLSVGKTPVMVVASSDKVYGRQEVLPVRETATFEPWHPYDASKGGGDLAALAYAREYGLPIAVTRMANIYGPGDTNWRRIIPGTVKAVLSREPVIIRSDGTQVREYIYIRDAVDAYLKLAHNLQNGYIFGDWFSHSPLSARAFNFPGYAATPMQIVRHVAHLLPHGETPRVKILNQAQDETPEVRLHADDVFDLVGQYLKTDIVTGLRSTVTWTRAYLREIGVLHG